MQQGSVRIRVRGPRGLALVVVLAATLGMTASVALAQENARYADVPSDSHYAGAVNMLAAEGVFVGTECDAGFCPDEPVDHATMAVWIVRVLDEADPALVSSTRFADVDAAHPHAAFIERLAELGLTAGCGDGTDFCPDDAVTRAQMAWYLAGAFDLAEGSHSGFSDVPSGAWYAKDVVRFAALGIAIGCGDGTLFCPDHNVTRAEMATYLASALEASSEAAGTGSSGTGNAETAEREPEVSEAAEREPEVSEAQEAEPEVSEAQEREPEVSETAEREPEVSETAEREPEVSEAQEAEPEVSEAQEAEPEESESPEPDTQRSDPPETDDTCESDANFGGCFSGTSEPPVW